MAIPQHTIDQILDRTDLVDLISQRVKLKKTGRTYSGCCPFHQEKSPSFHVYRDKQYYHCFGCQANGNAIRFLMDIDQRNFIEVMKDLSSRTGIELPQDDQDDKKLTYKRAPLPAPIVATPKTTPARENTPNQADASLPTTEHFSAEEMYYPDLENFTASPFDQFDDHYQAQHDVAEEGSLIGLLESVTSYYQQQLTRSTAAQHYFKQRGLSQETINFWRLGYAPEDWQHLEKAFPQDIEGLKALGLIRSSDKGRDFDLLRDRVIFPIRDNPKGKVVGFGGRALNDEVKPKYINSPDSEVFHKNQLLFGLYEGQKQNAKNWLMVEGYMDVIALHQHGLYGAVATLGTASNTDHLNLLFKRNPRLTIAFDGDNAGQKAARRTLEIALPLLSDGRELKFFVLPPEHDPDSLMRKEGLESFQRHLEQAPLLSDFIFAHLTQQHQVDTPEGKSQVMGDLRQLTELLPKHGSFRYLLTQAFKEKLGVGRRWTPKISHDASLSFNIRTKDEDFAIALVLMNPLLYTHFEILRAYLNDYSLLHYTLDIFDQIFDQIPDDQDQAIYYILGACSEHRHEFSEILTRVNIEDMLKTPERAFNHATEYSLALQHKYVKNKIKSAKNLIESRNLRQQLNELTKLISLRLVHETT